MDTLLGVLKFPHNHPKDGGQIEKIKVMSDLRLAAVANFDIKPRELIDRVLSSVPEDVKELLPSYESMKKNVFRARKGNVKTFMGKQGTIVMIRAPLTLECIHLFLLMQRKSVDSVLLHT